MAASKSVKQCFTLIFSWTESGYFIESTVDRNRLNIRFIFRNKLYKGLDSVTAWKVSVFRVFLVRIFSHLDWIRRDTEQEYECGKYGSEKLQIRTLFMQWVFLRGHQLTHFWPMFPFYTLLKHQKTKGYEMGSETELYQNEWNL